MDKVWNRRVNQSENLFYPFTIKLDLQRVREMLDKLARGLGVDRFRGEAVKIIELVWSIEASQD